jgi:2-polyprenyl-6-methoxyphenol hydroxylase-like FAD-dependent oxidoreductase
MIDRIPLDELRTGLVGAGGRLVLLGDAAHAMHSGPAQGARMGFEVGGNTLHCIVCCAQPQHLHCGTTCWHNLQA